MEKVRLEQKSTALERNNLNHSAILFVLEQNLLQCLKGSG